MSTKSIASVIADFVSASKKHYEYTLLGDYKKINPEAKKIARAFSQIQELGSEAREELANVMHAEDKEVAVMAAAYSLKYKTAEAKKVLAELSNLPGVLGFSAQQSLERWEAGDWHLE